MIGVHVPEHLVKQIGKLMVALGCDRSAAIRWLLEAGLGSGMALTLLRASKGKRQSDQICQVIAAGLKHRIAVSAVKRAGPRTSLDATLRAHRAAEEAAELRSSLADRIALRQASKSSAAARPATLSVSTPPNILQPPTRKPRELTAAEVKVAVDRALARAAKGTSSSSSRTWQRRQ